MTTFARYLLFQLPGWAAAAAVLAWFGPQVGLSPAMAIASWLLWAFKDLLLYPLVSTAYERRSATGAQQLVGKTAVVSTPLTPCGQVRIRGELWRACVAIGTDVEVGTRVVVVRGEGLTLHVETTPGGDAGPPRRFEGKGERGARV